MDKISTIQKDNHYQCKLLDCWIHKGTECDYDSTSEVCRTCDKYEEQWMKEITEDVPKDAKS